MRNSVVDELIALFVFLKRDSSGRGREGQRRGRKKHGGEKREGY